MAFDQAIRELLPEIVSSVVSGIPLPTLNLSMLAGSHLPPGIKLGLVNGATAFDQSYLLLEGDIAQVP
jgi:hypothetical protein